LTAAFFVFLRLRDATHGLMNPRSIVLASFSAREYGGNPFHPLRPCFALELGAQEKTRQKMHLLPGKLEHL